MTDQTTPLDQEANNRSSFTLRLKEREWNDLEQLAKLTGKSSLPRFFLSETSRFAQTFAFPDQEEEDDEERRKATLPLAQDSFPKLQKIADYYGITVPHLILRFIVYPLFAKYGKHQAYTAPPVFISSTGTGSVKNMQDVFTKAYSYSVPQR